MSLSLTVNSLLEGNWHSGGFGKPGALAALHDLAVGAGRRAVEEDRIANRPGDAARAVVNDRNGLVVGFGEIVQADQPGRALHGPAPLERRPVLSDVRRRRHPDVSS